MAGDTIFYTVMIDGLSYRHGQTVLVDPRYVIHSQRIEGGFVIREMKRNPVFIGTFCILFPLLFVVRATTLHNIINRRTANVVNVEQITNMYFVLGWINSFNPNYFQNVVFESCGNFV